MWNRLFFILLLFDTLFSGVILQQMLTERDDLSEDEFGYSSAITTSFCVFGAPFNEPLQYLYQGAAYVFASTISGPTVQWNFQQKLGAGDGGPNDHFGWSVSIDGNTIVIGSPGSTINGNSQQGAVYVFTYSEGSSPWNIQQKLTASDGNEGDEFGVSVSISGNTIVIGAPGAMINGNPEQGASYVFTQSGTNSWIQQKLIASDGNANDAFGISVSISGNTIVVGAPNAMINGISEQGASYVFGQNGTGYWIQQQKLISNDVFGSNQNVNQSFGYSVGVLANDTIVIGAPGTNAYKGAVYVFNNNGTMWVGQQQLNNNNASGYDFFGWSVSISGSTIAASAPRFSASHASVYIFTFITSSWTQSTTSLSDLSSPVNSFFGLSLSLASSNPNLLAIGAPLYNYFQIDKGAGFIYARNGSYWNLELQAITTDNQNSGECLFGFSVSMTSSLLAVGSPLASILTPSNVPILNGGAAYLFSQSSGSWSLQQRLTPSDGENGFIFGYSISLSENILVVGSLNAYNTSITPARPVGAAYVFSPNGTDYWIEQQKLTANDGAVDDAFGCSVSVSGNTIVVGACQANISQNVNQGAVYVFTQNGNTWTQQQKVVASDGATNDSFGYSVSISNDVLIVGAPYASINDVPFQGAVYAYIYNGTQWIEFSKFTPNGSYIGYMVGFSVSISGNSSQGIAVIGAPQIPIQGPGAAFISTFNSMTGILFQPIVGSDSQPGDNFGYSVSVSDNLVVVGAQNVSQGSGAAYIFVQSNLTWIETQKLISANQTGDFFGASVTSATLGSNDFVTVGAYKYSEGFLSQIGAAYVFTETNLLTTQQQTTEQFTLTQQVNSTQESNSPEKQQNSNNAAIGIIIGIVLGVVLIAAILIIVIFLVIRRKNKKDDPVEPVELSQKRASLSPELFLSEEVVIGEKLGKGNFGNVYKGKLGRTNVAIKEVKGGLDEVENEVKVLRALKHPNIVEFFGLKEQDGKILIIMELMNHGSLLDYIRNEDRFPDDLLINMAFQIASGMAYLEEHSIIHKDLALRNVLINIEFKEVICKVSDFGLSKILPQNYEYFKITTEEQEQAALPIKWSAPELLFSEKINPKVDVFSFGCVLFELFSKGEAPWLGYSNPEVIKALRKKERSPLPEDFGPQLIIKIMNECWLENPQERPTFKVLREKLAAVPAPEKKKPAPTSDSNPEIVYQTSS